MAGAVNALLEIQKKLEDPYKRLNWTRTHDPCTSNWTGVICSPADKFDGYMHVQELYALLSLLLLEIDTMLLSFGDMFW